MSEDTNSPKPTELVAVKPSLANPTVAEDVDNCPNSHQNCDQNEESNGDKDRARLLPANAEELIFLHDAWPVVEAWTARQRKRGR